MALRKITCSTCDTVYRIDESRIPNKRVVRSKCKKCNSVIVINQQTAEPINNSPSNNDAAKVMPPKPPKPVKTPKPSAATTDKGKQKLPKPLAEFKRTIWGYLYSIDAIEGWEKFVYIILKALGVLLVCKFIIFIMALFLPAMISNMIGLSLFVLILNWRTISHLDSLSTWQSLLIKKNLLQLTLPLILVNLYAFLSQGYGLDILPLLFGILSIAAFILLPFYVNYHLAIEHEQNVPKIILLTVIGSWFVTFYLTVVLEEDDEDDQG